MSGSTFGAPRIDCGGVKPMFCWRRTKHTLNSQLDHEVSKSYQSNLLN